VHGPSSSNRAPSADGVALGAWRHSSLVNESRSTPPSPPVYAFVATALATATLFTAVYRRKPRLAARAALRRAQEVQRVRCRHDTMVEPLFFVQRTRSQGVSPMSAQDQAEALRKRGNELFKGEAVQARRVPGPHGRAERRYLEACEEYTRALAIDVDNVSLLSNRAFCHTKLENYGLAVQDAAVAIAKDPKFVKVRRRARAADSVR
jgi:hypothetical protein